MADPPSLAAGVIAVLSWRNPLQIIFRAGKDASKDCKKLVVKISSVRGLLSELSDRFDGKRGDEDDADSDEEDSWSATLPLLKDRGGPLELLRTALQELNSKLAKCASTTGIKKLKNSLLWPLTKDQTNDLLGIIER
jgi:hypothetical protein